MHRLSLPALALLFSLLSPSLSGAAASKDESNLLREAARLDRTAASQAGETAVVKRITKDFGTDQERVSALRGKGLGYGELAVVLSLAQKLPDGINDANVQKVLGLRQGPPVLGWGEIAKQLHIKLGTVVSQVKKANNEAHREMKTDHEAQQPQTKDAAPAAPEAERHGPRKSFSGEGKDMTRGSAAK